MFLLILLLFLLLMFADKVCSQLRELLDGFIITDVLRTDLLVLVRKTSGENI